MRPHVPRSSPRTFARSWSCWAFFGEPANWGKRSRRSGRRGSRSASVWRVCSSAERKIAVRPASRLSTDRRADVQRWGAGSGARGKRAGLTRAPCKDASDPPPNSPSGWETAKECRQPRGRRNPHQYPRMQEFRRHGKCPKKIGTDKCDVLLTHPERDARRGEL